MIAFAQPYFVSPHAVRRYQERIDRTATHDECILEIQRLLQRRCVYPPTRTLAVSDRERRLIAIIQPSDPSRDRAWPQVTTIWRWRDFLFKEDGRPRRRKLGSRSTFITFTGDIHHG